MAPDGTFEIQFLGTGNTWCDAGRANQAILVRTEQSSVLVDCGPNTSLQAKKLGVDLTQLDAILLTHLHADHTFGLPTLLLEMNFFHQRTEPLKIYGPPGSVGFADDALRLAYRDVHARGLEYAVNNIEIAPGGTIDLPDCTVTTFEMKHSVIANGFRFDKDGRSVAITGDTVPCSGLVEMCRGLDLLITECSFPEPIPGVAHTALNELHEIRDSLEAKRVAVVHTDGVSDYSPYEHPSDGDTYHV